MKVTAIIWIPTLNLSIYPFEFSHLFPQITFLSTISQFWEKHYDWNNWFLFQPRRFTYPTKEWTLLRAPVVKQPAWESSMQRGSYSTQRILKITSILMVWTVVLPCIMAQKKLSLLAMSLYFHGKMITLFIYSAHRTPPCATSSHMCPPYLMTQIHVV